MSDLFEDPQPLGNAPEFSVSEISGAVKRMIEGEFGHVRVRGEVGRVMVARTGHMYFDLKDDRAVLAAVSWKGQVARMAIRPEEGMEVIATGRLTTFPGQSKYQIIVDDVVPAGAGALMAMLEKRKAMLAAEGLFAPERKKPIPYLPGVIGVVTSPTGAVIRDILHRLRDRFPSRVLIWPVAVQGEKCAPEVAAAIRGFNALQPGGAIPRPDLLIVARGGGSIEDLWGFNEEIVVRAAAESRIPLISAVGHETDTTLIDHAADRRAPTPTAAAEMAVPVRLDLMAALDSFEARQSRAAAQGIGQRRQRLRDLARALPRPETLVGQAAQRLDIWSERLPGALRSATAAKRTGFVRVAGILRPRILADRLSRLQERLGDRSERMARALERPTRAGRDRLSRLAPRLDQALARIATRDTPRRRSDLALLGERLGNAERDRLDRLADRLAGFDRLLQTLGYTQTLARGFAVVRGDGHVVTTRAGAEAARALEIQFHDGRLQIGGGAKPGTDKPTEARAETGAKPARKTRQDPPPDQGSLF